MKKEKLKKLNLYRDNRVCKESLDRLEKCARTGEGNLLEFAICASKARATVGEITEAMEKVFGRHKAEVKLLRNIYKKEIGENEIVNKVKKEIEVFRRNEKTNMVSKAEKKLYFSTTRFLLTRSYIHPPPNTQTTKKHKIKHT